MFFLQAASNKGLVILHVKGYNNEEGFGFVDGEGIFEVKQTGEQTMQVVRQVGVVQIEGDELSFNYTDAEFKKSIGYQEQSGYSTLDGGCWTIQRTQYLDSEGKTQHDANPNIMMHFMYSGANNPFMQLPNLATLFSQANNRYEKIKQAQSEKKRSENLEVQSIRQSH